MRRVAVALRRLEAAACYADDVSARAQRGSRAGTSLQVIRRDELEPWLRRRAQELAGATAPAPLQWWQAFAEISREPVDGVDDIRDDDQAMVHAGLVGFGDDTIYLTFTRQIARPEPESTWRLEVDLNFAHDEALVDKLRAAGHVTLEGLAASSPDEAGPIDDVETVIASFEAHPVYTLLVASGLRPARLSIDAGEDFD